MISIVCSNCQTPYTVPDHLAGKTVACKRCNALLDVPSRTFRPMSSAGGATGYERVLGRSTPPLLEVLGIHARFDAEGGPKEIIRLVLSFRHIALIIALLILWAHYAGTPLSARASAPFFFAASLGVLLAGWLQMNSTSRTIAVSLGAGRSSSFVSHALSCFLLVASDWRAAMPAMRTFFWALTLIAALSLASEAGGLSYILPLNSLPSFTTAPNKPATPAPPKVTTPETSVTPPVPASRPVEIPPPPPTTDKPIPPPEDNTPIAPPPG